MEQFLPILVLAVLATAFAAVSLTASRLLGPRKPTPAKSAPYECGIIPTRQPSQRFPVRFYLVAMIFVIFDIEIIFLYPWAVMYHQLDVFGLAEMMTFSVAVLVAFLYLLSNGALDWGPVQRLAQTLPPTWVWAGASTATIRQVPRPEALLAGLEGMEGSTPDPEPVPVGRGR